MPDGEVTCWGVDTYNPSGNEDPDGPTPGDVHQIYGASHQNGDAYVLHVGDIDVVSLGVVEQAVLPWSVYPSPVADALTIQARSGVSDAATFCIRILNSSGRLVLEERAARRMTLLDVETLPSGLYTVQIIEEMRHKRPAICHFIKS